MKKTLGKTIKIGEFLHGASIAMIPYSYHSGTIVGKKQIHQELAVPIVEFNDFTRIWVLEQEIIVLKSATN